MIRIDLDMNMPEECHECPFQLKFKDDEVDPWYMRRCVIMHRNIEYPRPEWCPLEEQGPVKPISRFNKRLNETIYLCGKCETQIEKNQSYCGCCGREVEWNEQTI